MASNNPSRAPTPPYHPTYGVHLSDDSIKGIILAAFPSSRVLAITQIPSGKAYNNRIYFIKIQPLITEQGGLSTDELVLKVSGRFWGPEKVQNEVACLRFLANYCPEVPVPKAFAWSDDGRRMFALSSEDGRPREVEMAPCLNTPGWILENRMPGEAIASLSLDEATVVPLAAELAGMVASWRRWDLRQKYCGNLLLLQNQSQQQQADLILESHSGTPSAGSRMLIRNLLPDNIKVAHPISTEVEYSKIQIENQLRELETQDVYTPNRCLEPLIRKFLNDRLPQFHLARDQLDQPFVFTHYDLSPRNVLVSGSPPSLSGIVDFEFAGFFPLLDEFVNDLGGKGSSDWPHAVYDSYLERLEELGVKTPRKGADEKAWREAVWFGRLVAHVAPWWLPGGFSKEDLERELSKSKRIVEETIEKLTSSSSN